MKGIASILLCAIAIVILYRFAMLVRPVDPASYVGNISLEPSTYANVDTVTRDDFVLRSYAYEGNQFVDALNDSASPPELADDNGNLPVFKYDGDVFIILHKGMNESGGLAISDNPEFASQIQAIDGRFAVHHIKESIYEWELDLERRASN